MLYEFFVAFVIVKLTGGFALLHCFVVYTFPVSLFGVNFAVAPFPERFVFGAAAALPCRALIRALLAPAGAIVMNTDATAIAATPKILVDRPINSPPCSSDSCVVPRP